MSVAAQVVKKFINDPETVVPEALAGVAAAHPGLVRVDLENQLVLRADAPPVSRGAQGKGQRGRMRDRQTTRYQRATGESVPRAETSG